MVRYSHIEIRRYIRQRKYDHTWKYNLSGLCEESQQACMIKEKTRTGYYLGQMKRKYRHSEKLSRLITVAAGANTSEIAKPTNHEPNKVPRCKFIPF